MIWRDFPVAIHRTARRKHRNAVDPARFSSVAILSMPTLAVDM